MLTTIEIPTDLKVHTIIGYMDKLFTSWYHACSWVCRGAVFHAILLCTWYPKIFTVFYTCLSGWATSAFLSWSLQTITEQQTSVCTCS